MHSILIFILYLGIAYAGPVTIPDQSITIPQHEINGGAACGSCVFPFIYKNRKHYTCTSIDADDDPQDPKKWCSTKSIYNEEDEYDYDEYMDYYEYYDNYHDDYYNEHYDEDEGKADWIWCTEDSSCPGMTVASTPQINANPKNARGKCFCGIPNYPFSQNRAPRVVGGGLVAPGGYPWQVAILFGMNPTLGKQRCGGTLIGDRYVISAASCTLNEEAILWARIGDTSLDTDKEVEGAVTIKVKEIIYHPDFNPFTLENDITLLVLKRKVSLRRYPNIKPACLPTRGSTHTGIGYISGWGTLHNNGPRTSWLHATDVNIYEKKNCGEVKEEMTHDQMCAGLIQGGIDACLGDTGGPLVTKDSYNNNWMTLVGVISGRRDVNGQPTCAKPNSLGIYSKVSENIDWLYAELEKKNMPNLVTCPKHTEWNSPDEGDQGTGTVCELQYDMDPNEWYPITDCREFLNLAVEVNPDGSEPRTRPFDPYNDYQLWRQDADGRLYNKATGKVWAYDLFGSRFKDSDANDFFWSFNSCYEKAKDPPRIYLEAKSDQLGNRCLSMNEPYSIQGADLVLKSCNDMYPKHGCFKLKVW